MLKCPATDPRSPVQDGGRIPIGPVLAILVALGSALLGFLLSRPDPQPEPPVMIRDLEGPPVQPATGPARAKSSLAAYVMDDDYPIDALRNNEQGTVAFALDVSPQGRVTGCTITQSSGSASLDAATCRIMRSRAAFQPARDDSGRAASDRVTSRIRWVIPAG